MNNQNRKTIKLLTVVSFLAKATNKDPVSVKSHYLLLGKSGEAVKLQGHSPGVGIGIMVSGIHLASSEMAICHISIKETFRSEFLLFKLRRGWGRGGRPEP